MLLFSWLCPIDRCYPLLKPPPYLHHAVNQDRCFMCWLYASAALPQRVCLGALRPIASETCLIGRATWVRYRISQILQRPFPRITFKKMRLASSTHFSNYPTSKSRSISSGRCSPWPCQHSIAAVKSLT